MTKLGSGACNLIFQWGHENCDTCHSQSVWETGGSPVFLLNTEAHLPKHNKHTFENV